MEYNINLDVFLLRNFIVNLLLLISCSFLLRTRRALKRLIFSAAVGSGCAVLMLFCKITVYFSFGTVFIMILIAFGKENRKSLAGKMCCLLILTFSAEGAIRFTHSGWSVSMVVLISYLLGKERRENPNCMDVVLHFKGKSKKLKGFFDTGNRLMEPVTGQMVHITAYEQVKNIFPKAYQEVIEHYFQTGILESTKVTKLQMYEFTFLSYHSIGKETGQLLGIRMDMAEIYNSAGKKTEEKAVIGLTEQKILLRNGCQIILNGRLEI